MSKYKVGDKVLFEGVIIDTEANDSYPYRVKFSDGSDEIFKEETLCFSKTYEDGLNDAWELARKICGMTRQAWYEIFKIEDAYLADILDDNTPQEALAKIEAYEESKAIKVGNVVFNAREDVKAVIMDNAIATGAWQVYTENGCVELWKECEFKKTGKTVDIEHLLEQIRGNE